MSEVYLIRAVRPRYDRSESLVVKIPELLEKAGIRSVVKNGDMVAIKVHFGVNGGYRGIRPQFIRAVVDVVKNLGGKPFVTDTWGLNHLDDAYYNGISHATVGAPVLPANGIKENDFRIVKLDKYYRLSEVEVAGNIYDADVLINFAHAKGHGGAGYGGAIKNLALGCVTERVRGAEHSKEREGGVLAFHEAMADVVKAVLSNKKNKVLHVLWIMDVVEHCDCAPFGMIPLVPDIGIAASKDIVAIDKAALDLINQAPSIPGSAADKYGLKPGENKFLRIHGVDPYTQVTVAEKAGLGSTQYKLIEF